MNIPYLIVCGILLLIALNMIVYGYVKDNSDFIGYVDNIGWITVARLGSEGLMIDFEEWEGFVGLVNMLDENIKNIKEPKQ